jgi:uncharacterized membrane protein
MDNSEKYFPDYVKKIFIFICIFIIFINLLLESGIKIIGSFSNWGVLFLLIFFIWLIIKIILGIIYY